MVKTKKMLDILWYTIFSIIVYCLSITFSINYLHQLQIENLIPFTLYIDASKQHRNESLLLMQQKYARLHGQMVFFRHF